LIIAKSHCIISLQQCSRRAMYADVCIIARSELTDNVLEIIL
jgi:hypothetical protein